MSNTENEIDEWLKNRNIDQCNGLRLNEEFTKFMKGVYVNKTEEEIIEQIRKCCIAFNSDLEGFIGCVDTGLSN